MTRRLTVLIVDHEGASYRRMRSWEEPHKWHMLAPSEGEGPIPLFIAVSDEEHAQLDAALKKARNTWPETQD